MQFPLGIGGLGGFDQAPRVEAGIVRRRGDHRFGVALLALAHGEGEHCLRELGATLRLLCRFGRGEVESQPVVAFPLHDPERNVVVLRPARNVLAPIGHVILTGGRRAGERIPLARHHQQVEIERPPGHLGAAFLFERGDLARCQIGVAAVEGEVEIDMLGHGGASIVGFSPIIKTQAPLAVAGGTHAPQGSSPKAFAGATKSRSARIRRSADASASAAVSPSALNSMTGDHTCSGPPSSAAPTIATANRTTHSSSPTWLSRYASSARTNSICRRRWIASRARSEDSSWT